MPHAPTPHGMVINQPAEKKSGKRGLIAAAIVFGGLLLMLLAGLVVSMMRTHEETTHPPPPVSNDTEPSGNSATTKLEERHKTAQNQPAPQSTTAPPPGGPIVDSMANQNPGADANYNPAAAGAYQPPAISPAQQRKNDLWKQRQDALTTPLAQMTAWHPPAAQTTEAMPSPAPAPSTDLTSLLPQLAALVKPGTQAPASQEAKSEERTPPDEPLATVRRPPTRYTLGVGSWIHLRLDQKIVSELPGQIGALVDEAVRDDQGNVLIPQGSRLFGDSNNRLAYGQERMLQVWNLLVFPDGSTMPLNDLQGYGSDGSAGVKDHVDNRWGPLLRDAALITAFSVGIALTQRQNTSALTNPSFSATVAQQVGANLGQVGSEMIQRNLHLSPIAELRGGLGFFTRLKRSIVFDGPYTPMEAQ